MCAKGQYPLREKKKHISLKNMSKQIIIIFLRLVCLAFNHIGLKYLKVEYVIDLNEKSIKSIYLCLGSHPQHLLRLGL